MPTAVRRIAHLSDVHMLGRSPARRSSNLGLRLVSFGRTLDPPSRERKLKRALAAAERCGADHVVISGDLTEIGAPDQFEAFAHALADSRISPDRITLVPGNHDAYTSEGAWAEALEGPLKPYAATSARRAGDVVERGDICFLPLDVACHQALTRSAGELRDEAANVLEARLQDPWLGRRALVLVQHHPPFARPTRAWQWLDGLRGWRRVMDWLVRFPQLGVLHGHLHHVVDRVVQAGKSRVFGAPAVVEDREMPRVRMYEVRAGMVESVGLAAL